MLFRSKLCAVRIKQQTRATHHSRIGAAALFAARQLLPIGLHFDVFPTASHVVCAREKRQTTTEFAARKKREEAQMTTQ